MVSKAKINLNKYWHKFEEILTAASEDIKIMSNSYQNFISSHKMKTYKFDDNDVDVDDDKPDMIKDDKLSLFATLRRHYPPANNVHDELNAIIGKSFSTEIDDNNINESMPTYKQYLNDELYYGVNLHSFFTPEHTTNASTSMPALTTLPNNRNPMKRCSCHMDASVQEVPNIEQQNPSKKYNFNHRNISITYEDYQNLENEAIEVCKRYSYYDTSF